MLDLNVGIPIHGGQSPISSARFMYFALLMNCCSPLRKAILMDYTTKEARGRWNSLDGITRFGWSGTYHVSLSTRIYIYIYIFTSTQTGSAFLGGYLVDQKGYGYTFRITAPCKQQLGRSLWLIPLVFMERSVDKEGAPRRRTRRRPRRIR